MTKNTLIASSSATCTCNYNLF